MATIAKLVADLRLDTAKFKSGLNDAGRVLNSSTAKMKRSLKSIKKEFKGVTSEIFNMKTAAIGLAVGGLGALIKKSIETADTIGKTADKVGLTTKQLQQMRFAASQTGVEIRTSDMAFQRFSRRVGEVAAGQGELKALAEQYNVTMVDSQGRMKSNIQLMGEFADIIKNTQGEQERLRIAFKLFDSEGAALVNMMKLGSAGINEMRKEAEDLGLVLDERLIRAAEEANDQLDIMGRIIQTHLLAAVLELMPEIINGTKAIIDMTRSMKENRESIQHFAIAVKGAASSMAIFAAAVVGGGVAITTTLTGIAAAATRVAETFANMQSRIKNAQLDKIPVGLRQRAAGLPFIGNVFKKNPMHNFSGGLVDSFHSQVGLLQNIGGFMKGAFDFGFGGGGGTGLDRLPSVGGGGLSGLITPGGGGGGSKKKKKGSGRTFDIGSFIGKELNKTFRDAINLINQYESEQVKLESRLKSVNSALSLVNASQEQRNRVLQNAIGLEEKEEIELRGVSDEYKRMKEMVNSVRGDLQGYLKDKELILRAQKEFNLTLDQTNELLKASKESHGLLKEESDTISQLEQAARGFGKTFEDAVINAAKGGKDAFRNMAEAILEDLARIIIQMTIIRPLTDSFANGLGGMFGAGGGGGSSSSGGGGGFFSKLFGGLFGGFRAKGGPVEAGKTYVVGENKRPEFFTPSSNGHISTSPPGGGGGSVTYMTVNIQAVDSQSFQQALRKQEGFLGQIAVAANQKAHNMNGTFGPMDRRRGAF